MVLNIMKDNKVYIAYKAVFFCKTILCLVDGFEFLVQVPEDVEKTEYRG